MVARQAIHVEGKSVKEGRKEAGQAMTTTGTMTSQDLQRKPLSVQVVIVTV